MTVNLLRMEFVNAKQMEFNGLEAGHFDIPPSIRFSPIPSVVDRMKKVIGNDVSSLLRFSGVPGGPATGYSINAKYSIEFFASVRDAHMKGFVTIDQELFQKTIASLTEKKFLSASQERYYQEAFHFVASEPTVNEDVQQWDSIMCALSIVDVAKNGHLREALELYRENIEVRQHKQALESPAERDRDDLLLKVASQAIVKAAFNPEDETPLVAQPSFKLSEEGMNREELDYRSYSDKYIHCGKVTSAEFFDAINEANLKKAAMDSNVRKICLDMWFTKYDLALTEAIAAFIAKSPHVKVLDLGATNPPSIVNRAESWHYRLNEDTIKPIAEALRKNCSIVQLDLYETAIGDSGVMAILKAIEDNPSSKVKEINFFCCMMSPVGANAVLNFVRSHPRITSINVGYNNIDRELEQEISDACKKNES